jgi:hypothetical protein
MTRRITPVLLTLLALLTPLALLSAQGPRGGPPGGTMKVPDPILFNGPPTPEDFLDLVGLDMTQYDAYRMQYAAFMEQTRPQRDSLLEFRRQMREAMAPGVASRAWTGAGRQGGGQFQKTVGEMEKRQKEFDEALKPILREPQLKRYEAWRRKSWRRRSGKCGNSWDAEIDGGDGRFVPPSLDRPHRPKRYHAMPPRETLTRTP